MSITVRLSRDSHIDFDGHCLAGVVARNHDGSIRRCFRLYTRGDGFVAERIDDPGTIEVRFWGCECRSELDVYEFFGNEPLANYLYGRLRFSVPGLDCEM